MKIEEVRMKHLFTWCHNENPMKLLSKNERLPMILSLGREGFIVAVDTSDCSDELKFLKLRTYIKGLNGYGVKFSFLFLRFSRGDEAFFYPAVAIYMERNTEPAIEHFSTLEYYADKAMGFGADADCEFANDYTMMPFRKGENGLIPDCEQLAAQANAQFDGFALAPSPTHNMERLPRKAKGELYVIFKENMWLTEL